MRWWLVYAPAFNSIAGSIRKRLRARSSATPTAPRSMSAAFTSCRAAVPVPRQTTERGRRAQVQDRRRNMCARHPGLRSAGAPWFGYTTPWVTRLGLPAEQRDTLFTRIGNRCATC